MRRILIFSCVLATAILLPGCSDNTNSNSATTDNSNAANTVARNSNANASSEQANASLSSDEKTFINEAAVGGMAEVELGKLAKQKAKSTEVKNFGQRMIDDHTKANNELMQMASSKGISPPKELDSRHKDTADRLSKLSGEQFDKAYMSDMVEDHEKDVAEFERQANQARDKDVKAFASKTLPTLQQHLQMARSINSKEQKEQ